MPDSTARAPKPRKARSLEDEIARQEARLKKLQDNLKEKKRKDYERNAKAVAALLQAEHLDQEPVEKWQQHLPAIKALLLENPAATPAGDQKEKPAPAAPRAADAG
jgi:hypothetical protein